MNESVDKNSAEKENESVKKLVEVVMEKRTPDPKEVIYEPTFEFLDEEGKLTREERGKVIALGDRTAISYKELKKRVIEERGKEVEVKGELTDKTASFYLQYSLGARSSEKIAHTSILEQVNPGSSEKGGDSPVIIEGVSILSALRDVCRERHFGFEAFSSRGGIFPEGYWRIPSELRKSKVGPDLESISKEIYERYIELTRAGLGHYLRELKRGENEENWRYQWRVLNHALDDSRQVTNGAFLNHLAMHPNSALSLREALVRFSSAELPETRKIADRLRSLAEKGLPTLMRYTEKSPYTESLSEKRNQLVKNLDIKRPKSKRGQIRKSRFLTAEVTPLAAEKFIAAFLAKDEGMNYEHVLSSLEDVSEGRITASIAKIFEGITLHDKPPEELEMIQVVSQYEMPVGAIYELVRHRLATHLVSGFTPDYGYSLPDAYKELGVEKMYKDTIELAERQYDIVSELGENERRIFGPYFITRAHIQPVTVRMSGSDLFHFLKIRAQEEAHPDIARPALGTEQFLRQNEGLVFGHLVKKQK